MTRYLIAVHRPNNYDPSAEDDAMSRDIRALNGEMVAAGVRVFVGGLQSPGTAKTLRMQSDGSVVVRDGLCLETGEHLGGFWVLEVSGLDEALTWGRKASIACRGAVEVRPFH
jgi:hypothetical protein